MPTGLAPIPEIVKRFALACKVQFDVNPLIEEQFKVLLIYISDGRVTCRELFNGKALVRLKVSCICTGKALD